MADEAVEPVPTGELYYSTGYVEHVVLSRGDAPTILVVGLHAVRLGDDYDLAITHVGPDDDDNPIVYEKLTLSGIRHPEEDVQNIIDALTHALAAILPFHRKEETR